ncbi:unnamed protein product [Clonostachys rosea]|uniref:Uncharacterized protein n=1 Tax=Bionectria ochroleuca TaxID=29856 RepID=A0ABY6U8Z1_BIOOC|nr:unnamed protein product [Clonostachys rosea]
MNHSHAADGIPRREISRARLDRRKERWQRATDMGGESVRSETGAEHDAVLEESMAEKLKDFPFFVQLPPEIQDRVWDSALEGVKVSPEMTKALFRRNVVFTILQVSQAAQDCVIHIAKSRMTNCQKCSLGGKLPTSFGLDDKGTLVMSWSTEKADTARIHDKTRLVLYRSRGLMSKSMATRLAMAKREGGPFIGENGLPRPYRDIIEIVMDDLGGLSGKFANLKDVTYVGKFVDSSWRMGDEYKVHGPEIVSRLPRDGYLSDQYEEMLKYYEQKGIADESGLQWPHGCLTHIRSWKEKTLRKETWAVTPNIGTRGFSYNRSSVGGVWAGFRVYLGDNPRVEFSPLSWEEVKEDTCSFQTFGKGRQSEYPIPTIAHAFVDGDDHNRQFPQGVIKIAIIRPGEQAPPSLPHHCWEAVAGTFDRPDNSHEVDWRKAVDFEPGPTWEPEKHLEAKSPPRPKNDMTEEEKKILAAFEKELKYFNRHRIQAMFIEAIRPLLEIENPEKSIYVEEKNGTF